mmetsp:Transcript_5651/g.10134  ORF Transcript_5651/g.10134 Transcript_5651/m.10134 type:complete len:89 (+) Transcript_5651:223-489(+)
MTSFFVSHVHPLLCCIYAVFTVYYVVSLIKGRTIHVVFQEDEASQVLAYLLRRRNSNNNNNNNDNDNDGNNKAAHQQTRSVLSLLMGR